MQSTGYSTVAQLQHHFDAMDSDSRWLLRYSHSNRQRRQAREANLIATTNGIGKERRVLVKDLEGRLNDLENRITDLSAQFQRLDQRLQKMADLLALSPVRSA